MSTSPATLRLKPRLRHLTSKQLLDLVAELASATAEGLRIADAHLAEHVVLPEGMVSAVLLDTHSHRRHRRAGTVLPSLLFTSGHAQPSSVHY